MLFCLFRQIGRIYTSSFSWYIPRFCGSAVCVFAPCLAPESRSLGRRTAAGLQLEIKFWPKGERAAHINPLPIHNPPSLTHSSHLPISLPFVSPSQSCVLQHAILVLFLTFLLLSRLLCSFITLSYPIESILDFFFIAAESLPIPLSLFLSSCWLFTSQWLLTVSFD